MREVNFGLQGHTTSKKVSWIGAQSSFISEPMLFTRLLCCQSGGEG